MGFPSNELLSLSYLLCAIFLNKNCNEEESCGHLVLL